MVYFSELSLTDEKAREWLKDASNINLKTLNKLAYRYRLPFINLIATYDYKLPLLTPLYVQHKSYAQIFIMYTHQ